MSFFTKTEEEVVLCSEMEGHITFKGKPVSNIKIERWIKWKDDVGDKDYFNTDDKGYFLLPEIKFNLKLSKISQFVVGQEIKVFFDDKEYLIWTVGKMSKDKYGELGGKPIGLRCELMDEEVPIRLDNTYLLTICKWDKIERLIKEQ